MKVYDISFNKQEEIIVKIIYITKKEINNPEYEFYIVKVYKWKEVIIDAKFIKK